MASSQQSVGAQDLEPRQARSVQLPGQIPQSLVMQAMSFQMQTPQGKPRIPNQQPFYTNQRPIRITRPPPPNNQPMYSSSPGAPMVQMIGPPGPTQFIPPGPPGPFMPPHVDFAQIPMGGPTQYQPKQAMQGRSPPVFGSSEQHGPYGYQPSTVFPMGQPSPPVYILRAPHTAPMPGIPQYQPPTFEPRPWVRRMIHILDPISNKDVTQEILNRQPSGSLTGSTSGTPNNITPNMSGQSSSSSTPPLTSQQQAEANVRAQFAAQVAAALANTEDKLRKPEYTIQKPPANNKAEVESAKVKEPVEAQKEAVKETKVNDTVRNVTEETKLAEKAIETRPKDVAVKSQPKEAAQGSKVSEGVTGDSVFASSMDATTSANEEISNVRVKIFTAEEVRNKGSLKSSTKSSATTKAPADAKGADSRAPDLDGVTDASRADGVRITYERDFLLQFQAHPMSMLRPEGLPDLEIVLRRRRTSAKSGFQQNRVPKADDGENMFLPAYLRQLSRVPKADGGESTFLPSFMRNDQSSSRERRSKKKQRGRKTEIPITQTERDVNVQDTGEIERVNSDDPPDSLASVPPEILARGRLAIEAYNKALREGTTCLKRLPVMLIGQDRSGKTSLKKSLKGEDFNPNEESTIGIDKDPSHFQVTTELWKAGVKDNEATSTAATSYEHHAAKLIVSSLTEEKQTPAEESPEPILSESPSLFSAEVTLDEDLTTLLTESLSPQKQEERNLENFQSRGFSITNTGSSFPILTREVASETLNEILHESETPDLHDVKVTDVPRDNSSSFSDEPELPHDIASLVEKLLHEGTKVEDEDIYSVLWDFGGQSVYYVTHPLFLTPRAIYVLVYDLSRNPCERADPPEKRGMFKTFKDQFSFKTHIDYLYFWMTSVSSLACQGEGDEVHSSPDCEVLPEKLPPVFLVCSHADKPYGGKDPRTLANDVFDSLQRKPYSNHLVERVFVVDNTLSGSELDCPEVICLREHILALAKELPQMKEVVPIKWLKYEKALHLTKEDGHKWISLESAKQIASEVCMIPDDQEFLTLLNFLHDQRIVIHFDDTPALEKVVVLDPQWLIDVFSKVITVKPYAHEERQFRDLWHKLEATGVLEDDLLKHVWGPLLGQQETSESLIAIMEKFSLLCPWPPSAFSSTKQYLVPSMLTSHPPQDIIDLVSSAQLPSLFVKFKSGQVPPGLFPRLMLQFLQWGKDEFWSAVNPHLFHNFARFYTSGDEDCSVVLLCHSSSIEVIVHRGNRSIELANCLLSKVNTSADAHYDAFEVACACTVQRQLSLMLESMRKEFCWLRNMRYEVGVICPVCCQGSVLNYCRDHHTKDCERGECLHFLSESKLRSAKQSIICTRSAAATNNKVYVKQFTPWFGCPTEQDSQQSVVKFSGGLLPSSTGNEGKSVALPRNVVELLSWQSTDPEEIVLQLKQSLPVDQASLEHPGPETKRLIRCLATKAKRSDRLDVVQHVRKITPAGTTGPLLPGELDIRNIPVEHMRKLTIDLSGGEEWKVVAERLGLTPSEIRFLDNRTLNPFDAVLAYISQRYCIYVDDLYDVLNDCGLPVVADLL